MPRDYKTRAKKPRRSTARGTASGRQQKAGLGWFITGLALGFVISYLIYLNTQTPDTVKSKAETATTDARSVRKAPVKELPQPPKPHYDFYDILPEMEVAVPESTNKDKVTVSPVTHPGNYILQAGSFQNHQDADRHKANLALLGVEASIQTVTINNKDTWHRVRVGPYSNLDDLNRVRSILRKNNVRSVLLKLKD